MCDYEYFSELTGGEKNRRIDCFPCAKSNDDDTHEACNIRQSIGHVGHEAA